MQAQVEDLLHVARVERGHVGVVEGDLGVARQRGGLGERIVPGQGQHAAVPAHARVVRVLEQVAGAVHPRRLAVPHADDAVVAGLREETRHLAAEHRGGPQVLVEAGGEDHVVGLQQHREALEGLIEPPERRAAVSGDERRGVETAPQVRPMMVEGQANQGLDAGQVDPPALLRVLGLERELSGLCGHVFPLWGPLCLRRADVGHMVVGTGVSGNRYPPLRRSSGTRWGHSRSTTMA